MLPEVEISLDDNMPEWSTFLIFATDVMDYLLDQQYDTLISIDVHPSLEGHAAGFCHGDDYHVIIDLALTSMGEPYTLSELARNLAHELVHASQYIQHDGVHPCPGLPPEQDPWERQAQDLEDQLVELFWSL